MDVREKMKKWREANDVTLKQLSISSGVSITLLKMVENGGVTHPFIVERIAKAYGLSESEGYELMPDIHNPTSPFYNPDKYKISDDEPHVAIKTFTEKEQVFNNYIANRRYARKVRGEYQP